MNFNLLLLKFPFQNNQVSLWKSFKDMDYVQTMGLTDFNCNYLNKLLQNISKEQKSVFLLGDFNVNLLNHNEYNQIN